MCVIWSDILVYVRVNVHRSIATSKPLTSEVNNNDHLVPMQYPAGELWGPGIHMEVALNTT